MHGTLASLKKKQSAFLASSSFELHAVLTLWNMNFLVTCHCFASATKVLFVESSIYDFGSMLSSVWKDGHFLSSCEKNIERCLKDKWQMASTSLDKNSSKPEKSHIPPCVGSNLPIQKCKQQWWLSRHHFHTTCCSLYYIWATLRVVVILVRWTRQALDVFSGSTNPHLPTNKIYAIPITTLTFCNPLRSLNSKNVEISLHHAVILTKLTLVVRPTIVNARNDPGWICSWAAFTFWREPPVGSWTPQL